MQIDKFMYKSFTPSERRCFNKIDDLGNKLLTMSLVELSEECMTSTSTVKRTLKKINFDSLKEFKAKLNEVNNELEEVNNFDNILLNTINNFDPRLVNRTINLINESKSIYIIGFGLTSSLALDLVLHLREFNINAIYISDSSMLEIVKASSKNNNDLIIYVSYSGEDSKMEALSFRKKNTCKQILITSKYDTKLSKNCDLILNSESYNKDDFLNSRIPLSIIISKILVNIKKELGY